MYRLEELIQELCPNGVPYISLGSMMTRVRERKKNNNNVSQVYVVSNTQGMVRAEEYRETTIHSEDTSNYTVIRKDMVAYNPSRLNIGSIAMLKEDTPGLVSPMYVVFSIDQGRINKNYYEYLIKSSFVSARIDSLKEEGARFRFDYSRWEKIVVPVPPLPVQEEIVRILDNFTELTTELTAELTARKKQYEYYREVLFSFDDNEAKNKPLGEEFPFIRNGFVGTVTPFFTSKDHGVRYLKGTNIHNGVISDNDVEYVTKEFHNKYIRNELKPDDIIMVQSGHVGECAVVGEKYAGANCHALIIMSNGGGCCSRYVMHYFQTTEGKKQLKRITTGGTVKHILASQMKKLVVPFPPLAEQERIVAILDRFDALCNDLSSGLPAEIEARKKQYEYYQDKLLTFKELDA